VKTEESKPAEAEQPASEEPSLISEPYIDTALCTSCNECININQVMFKYNDDKMAYIADPKAGTFADLVEAAENCPVAIIHPGEPLNPSEPGLEGLKERAKKFN
jgi:ferredoxin